MSQRPAAPPADAPAPHDAHLRAALRHAPDAAVAPPAVLSAAILREAQAAVQAGRHGADARGWRGLLGSVWAALGQPRVAGGLASVMLATVIGVMWWGRPFDEAGDPVMPPAAPATAGQAAAQAEPQAPPAPAPSPAPAAVAEQATAAPPPPAPTRQATTAPPAQAPAAVVAPPPPPSRRAAAPAAAERAEAAVTPPPADTPPLTAAKPAAEAVAPAAAPTPAPAPVAAPPPAAAVAAAPRPAPLAESLSRGALADANTAADRARVESRAGASAAPTPLAARAKAAAPVGDAAPTLAALHAAVAREPERWAWQRGGSARPMDGAVLAWLNSVAAAVPAAAGTEAEASGEPTELTLLRDGEPQFTLRLDGHALQWKTTGTALRRMPLTPTAAAGLRSTLDAATR